MAYPRELKDTDVAETREWLDALEYVLDNQGVDRANFLLERLSARMTKTGARLPYTITTASGRAPTGSAMLKMSVSPRASLVEE